METSYYEYPALDGKIIAGYMAQCDELLKNVADEETKREIYQTIMAILTYVQAYGELDAISKNQQYGDNHLHHTPKELVPNANLSAKVITGNSKKLNLKPPLPNPKTKIISGK